MLPRSLLAQSRTKGRRPKICILATEVRKYSHAQHFVDRFLEGYGWSGSHHYPPFELASLYVDQFPEGDLSRDRSQRHGVPILPSVSEALTLGTSKLAVDGVLIIAEHGRYPRNEKGQTLYPRYRFFKEVVKVFEESGRAVAVFNDKHLSTDWSEAMEMVADSERLEFPFIAGSSLPVTWRLPGVDLPLGTELEESVCACYGGVDSYDFHGFETAQCMDERRAGGESGIISVHARRGESLWAEVSRRPETAELLVSALSRSFTCRAPAGYTVWVPTIEWMSQVSPDAIGFFVEHADGLKTTTFLLNGLVRDFTYAGRSRSGDVISTQMYLPMPPQPASLANFFNPLVNQIERTILEGKPPYPVERTLLTTGMTLAGVESLHQGQVRVSTPEMRVKYSPSKEATYWRS